MNISQDPKVLGGVILQFGSLALDGSLQAALKDAGIRKKEMIEKGY